MVCYTEAPGKFEQETEKWLIVWTSCPSYDIEESDKEGKQQCAAVCSL